MVIGGLRPEIVDKECVASPYDQDTFSEVISIRDPHLEAESVKDDIEVNSEEPSGFIALGGYLRRERYLELARHGEEPKSCNNSSVDGSTVLLPTLLPPKFELPRKETDFYMDKEVTEVESPKVIICFQKDASQSIKDICIDEGNSNKDFQHIKEVEDQKVYMISPLMENEVSEAKKIPRFDCSESLYVVENPVLSSDQKDSLASKTGKANDTMNGNVTDSNVSANGPAWEELHHEQLLANSSCTNDEIKQAEAEHRQTHFLDCNDGKKPAEVDQDPLMVTNTIALPDSPTDNMNGHEICEGVPSNYHAQESRSSLDSVVKAEASDIATEKPNEMASELDQPFQGNDGSSTFGQHSTEDRITFPRNSLIPQMGVAMRGPSCLSDKIIYTGQGAYSGSISHRSDSSTTSTRSFAFPIFVGSLLDAVFLLKNMLHEYPNNMDFCSKRRRLSENLFLRLVTQAVMNLTSEEKVTTF